MQVRGSGLGSAKTQGAIASKGYTTLATGGRLVTAAAMQGSNQCVSTYKVPPDTATAMCQAFCNVKFKKFHCMWCKCRACEFCAKGVEAIQEAARDAPPPSPPSEASFGDPQGLDPLRASPSPPPVNASLGTPTVLGLGEQSSSVNETAKATASRSSSVGASDFSAGISILNDTARASSSLPSSSTSAEEVEQITTVASSKELVSGSTTAANGLFPSVSPSEQAPNISSAASPNVTSPMSAESAPKSGSSNLDRVAELEALLAAAKAAAKGQQTAPVTPNGETAQPLKNASVATNDQADGGQSTQDPDTEAFEKELRDELAEEAVLDSPGAAATTA